MAILDNVYIQVLSAAGSTVTLDLTQEYTRYVFTGTGALVGNVSIAPSGTPLLGHRIYVQWNCTFSVGGATTTIFGSAINSSLIGKNFIAEAYYNGVAWIVSVDADINQSQIISNANLVDSTIAASKIATNTIDIGNLNAQANKEIMVIEISFETNEQCNNTVKMPTNFTLNSIYYEVVKALTNTDVGTIIPKINGSVVTLNAAISIPLSTAINTTGTTNCIAANTGLKDDILSFVAAKTTPGGKARLTLNWSRTI